MRMFKNILTKIWFEAYEGNIENIIDLLIKKPHAKLLDIGCGDGQQTVKYAGKINTNFIYGIDGVKEKVFAAKKRGVKVKNFNLEEKWPYEDEEFDVITGNQIIEHILDLDNFISEIHRVLKPNGYCVISTENLSSWHNVLALAIGVQDFSHHLIKKSHVGNPFALHREEQTCSWSGEGNSGIDETNFPHVKIPTYRSLRKIFEVYNFSFVRGKGSGYYPLFGFFGRFMSQLDPYHSHFITIKVRKPRK